MNKGKLSLLQFSCLICFPIFSLYSDVFSYYLNKVTGVDSYLSILIAYLGGIVLYFLFRTIFLYKEDFNILEKNCYLFGNILGNIINVIMNFILMFIGIMFLYHISDFVISEFLDQTPVIVFMIILGSIIVYNVSKGIVNISRVAVIFLAIIFILTLFGCIGLIPYFKIQNLKPVLEFGMGRVMYGSVNMIIMNIVPMFLLLIIPKNRIGNDSNIGKSLFLFYSLSFLFVLIIHILTIGVYGIYLVRLYQYPEYITLQKISLFHFIGRIENFICIRWILTSVISISLVLYHIGKLFPMIKAKVSGSFLMGIMILFSLIIFRNNNVYYMICYSVFPYLCFILFFIYFIIWVNILIRRLLSKYLFLKK